MIGNTDLTENDAKDLVGNSINCVKFYIVLTIHGDVVLMLEDEAGRTYSGMMSLSEFKDQVYPVINMVQ